MAENAPPAHVLSHFLPRDVIAHARDLARSFQRDELFRVYVLKRMWLVIPAGFVFAAVSGAGASGTFALLAHLSEPPMTGWLPVVLLLASLFVFFGAMLSQLYALFSWLETRALRAGALEPKSASPPLDGEFDRTRRDRTRSTLWLIIAFVITPLVALAAMFPSVAVLLIMVAVFAPIVYTLFDR